MRDSSLGSKFGAVVVLIAAATAGCETPISVTGSNDRDPTWPSTQSETTINVSNLPGEQVITVAYNDETGNIGKIIEGDFDRAVFPGASYAGWSYSTTGGLTWTYGGKVTPSPTSDWPIIWADPAIISSPRDPHFVFLSYLALDIGSIPRSGVLSGLLTISGACISRSTDGGKSFALYQCFTNDLDQWDGSSMAADASGRIYAAYQNITKHRIDVWTAPNETSLFVPLTSRPFATDFVEGHPRLRVGPDGRLYVAAHVSTFNGVESIPHVRISRLETTGSWTDKDASVRTDVNAPDVKLAGLYPGTTTGRVLRTGPQFSFDVGTPSDLGGDEIRMVYTLKDPASKRLFLAGSYCSISTMFCVRAPGWGTSFDIGDQFNPNVRAAPASGQLGGPGQWKLSYLTTQLDPGGDTLSVRDGNLIVLPITHPDGSVSPFPATISFPLVPSHTICESKGGYWGDYDDLQLVRFNSTNGAPVWIRAFTDSSKGCMRQQQLDSYHVHVSSIVFQ